METTTNSSTSLLTRGQQYSVKDLCDAYMAQYDGRDETISRRMLFWAERFDNRPATEITEDDILDGLDALKERGVLRNVAGKGHKANVQPLGRAMKPSTINRYRFAIQAVYVWATRRRLLPKGFVHPLKDIPQEREDNARIRFLSADEYSRLLAASRVCAWPKLYALIQLAVTTGARKGALLGLRWQDIDLDNGRGYVERTKNGQPQVLVLLPDVVSELRKIRNGAPDGELVFSGRQKAKASNFTHTWAAVLKEARLNDGTVCFHTLRHTHASWLAQNGATLVEIADSMGHKSLVMTQRYSHLCVSHRESLVGRVFAQAA